MSATPNASSPATEARNTVVLRGRLSRSATSQRLESGAVLVRYQVTIPREEGRADTVPVVWIGSAEVRPAPVKAGTEVVVVGRVQRRFWRSPGGTCSSTEVAADHLLDGSERRRITALLKKVGVHAA